MFFSSQVHQRHSTGEDLGQPRSGPDGGGEFPREIVQGRHPLWSGESRSGSIWDPKSRNWSGRCPRPPSDGTGGRMEKSSR